MDDIVLSGISKAFDGQAVLSGLDAVFSGGQFTAVMGPSGCGKTTLFRILLGLEKADSGSISGMPEKRSAVFQEDRLCSLFGALGNLRAVTGRRYSRGELADAMARVGISEELDKPVDEYSGGMRRRVALVRAMLADSQIVLLDEPFKGLDEENRQLCMEYAKESAAGRTVLLITHSADEAEALCPGRILRLPGRE